MEPRLLFAGKPLSVRLTRASRRASRGSGGSGYRRGDVHDPAELAPPAAYLTGLDAQQCGHLVAPLLGQLLTVHPEQGWRWRAPR